MAVAGYLDIPLDVFSGQSTDYSPPDLPPGASPDCSDIVFELAGAVKTRPGLLAKISGLSGKGLYEKTYSPLPGVIKNLILDSSGTLSQETSDGVTSVISNAIKANSYGKSITQYGREYIAFSDGKFGIDIPRQFDGTNFDRVSQVGPGKNGAVADINTTVAITSITCPAALVIARIEQSGGFNTVTTTTPHLLTVGDAVNIAVVAASPYNGSYFVASTPSPTTFTVAIQGVTAAPAVAGTVQSNMATIITGTPHLLQIPGDAVNITGSPNNNFNNNNVSTDAVGGTVNNPATWSVASITNATTFVISVNVGVAGATLGGTLVPGGSIAAGAHQFAICFITRQGYITKPSPIGRWICGGSKLATFSDITIGPPNVVARLLLFTQAGQGTFFYIPVDGTNGTTTVVKSTIINDNITNQVTIDFSDAQLTAFGLSGQQFFSKLELGECAGVIAYNGRLFWWGERNKISNFNNLTFDGGTSAFTPNQPAGWSVPVGGGAGLVTTSQWQIAYRVVGDGVTATRGLITQSAFQDSFLVPIIRANIAYSARIQVQQFGNPVAGRLNVNMNSVSGAFTTVGLQVTVGQAPTTRFQEFIVSILPAQAVVPADLLLQVYVDQTPTNNAGWIVDSIEIFPTDTPFNDSQLRVSMPNGDPENYDGITGVIQVSPNDGQRITTCLLVRERLRIFKERASYSVADDGINEPSSWAITVDSYTKGCCSINGADIGEDWYLIADRTGFHISDGGEPIKVSQEISTVPRGSTLTAFWDNINWGAAETIWTAIDVTQRRAYVGVPIGVATSPTIVFLFDYRGLESFGAIANSPSVHQSSYSGKTFTVAKGRRWAPWQMVSGVGAMVERFDGSKQLFVGNGISNGKIYMLSENQLSDDGVAINSYYTTYAFLDEDQEIQMQLGGHLKIFPYLVGDVEGSGNLSIQALIQSLQAAPIVIPQLALTSPSLHDFERPTNIQRASRVYYRFGTNAVGAWFRLQRLTPSVGKDPAMVRGI